VVEWTFQVILGLSIVCCNYLTIRQKSVKSVFEQNILRNVILGHICVAATSVAKYLGYMPQKWPQMGGGKLNGRAWES
jgi:hypothetical protein